MIKALLTTVVALAVTALLSLPAGAHTAMLRASPDRDTTVGGSITVIDLEFLDPITDAVVAVTYNGAPLAGRTTVPEGKVITFTLDQPLAQPGRYQVTYEMISSDGDFTTGGYFFTFDPLAEQPARIEPTTADGLSTTVLALSGVGLVVLVGLLGLFVRRIDERRRHEAFGIDDAWPEDDGTNYYRPEDDGAEYYRPEDDGADYYRPDAYRADEYWSDEDRAGGYRAEEYGAQDHYR